MVNPHSSRWTPLTPFDHAHRTVIDLLQRYEVTPTCNYRIPCTARMIRCTYAMCIIDLHSVQTLKRSSLVVVIDCCCYYYYYYTNIRRCICAVSPEAIIYPLRRYITLSPVAVSSDPAFLIPRIIVFGVKEMKRTTSIRDQYQCKLRAHTRRIIGPWCYCRQRRSDPWMPGKRGPTEVNGLWDSFSVSASHPPLIFRL